MRNNKKMFFITVSLLLGIIIYFLCIKIDLTKTVIENESTEESITEDISYEKYLELRSNSLVAETYAIVIFDSDEDVSKLFIEEMKQSFSGRKSKVYLLNCDTLNDKQFSVVIDDVTDIMNYKQPSITIPTIIIMSKGEVVYKHAGFMYKEEMTEILNLKNIE